MTLTVAAMFIASLLLEGVARLRPGGRLGLRRSLVGAWLHFLMMMAAFGLLIAVLGDLLVAATLCLLLVAVVVVVSNFKYAVIGEPLLFTDLALVGEVIRHPQFYVSVVRPWQAGVALLAILPVVGLLLWLADPSSRSLFVGILTMAASLAAIAATLRWMPWPALGLQPLELERDVRAHGLLVVMLLYWARWRRSTTAAAEPLPAISADLLSVELLIMVQSESFADPAEMFGDPALALPGLRAAREAALARGRLLVSSFGANTMRTEYGVLFGRPEEALEFRRFNPFLTAAREGAHALAARLKPAGWRSLFIHPHDLRFYSRHLIMPAAGFDALVGEKAFETAREPGARYVPDAAVADRILEMAAAATGPLFIYAVTIENHGPWSAAHAGGPDTLVDGYLRLVARSDQMLAKLQAALAGLGKPALLVFFGDHRPSIPGVTDPCGRKDTPFVMLRVDAEGRFCRGAVVDHELSPAGLHHAVLEAMMSQVPGRERYRPEPGEVSA